MNAALADGDGANSTALPEESTEMEVDRVAASMGAVISQRIDRCFAILMIVQWLSSLTLAIWVTPRTWIGAVSAPSPYIAIAVFCGGVISLTPALLAWRMPGSRYTRHSIAIGQMLMGTLLIHLAGGRLEMHFHIFGSLAFLAFYLDWTVLLTASLVVLLDHGMGNFLWPRALFGFVPGESWRWLEHVGWVAFCDVFLIASCISRARNLRVCARHSVCQTNLLLRQAYSDALTGLPNRLRFRKDMESSIQEASRNGTGFALMYVDLDRFKEVNDTHGHAVGDRVLVTVAERLLQASTGTTRFARIGGDEFVAICPRTGGSIEEVTERACDVLRCLLVPIEIDDLFVRIGASIGVSLYPEDGIDEDRLMGSADRAMYSVKRKGRCGFVFYDRAMDATEADRSAAEVRLRKAIRMREFVVYYQPLLSREGKLSGLEALVRWLSHGDDGVVRPPSEFIPLAEETGLIVELGTLIIEQVCEQVASWHASGVPFGEIAINLSPRQLEQGTFPSMLDQTMGKFGVRPEWIAFEITESAYLPDDHVLEVGLEALRNRGIKVSLDDFGTGYSSLGRLQSLMFNTLKLDRIFIAGLGKSEASFGMVKAIINLAHLLGMSVVGEGVENAAQAGILRELGCDQLQGFYLSRPLSAIAVRKFILQHSSLSSGAASAVIGSERESNRIERRVLAKGVTEMIAALTPGQRDSAARPGSRP